MREKADASKKFKTGSTNAGKFVCTKCGGKIHLKKPGRIPPCYKCSNTRFHRMQEKEMTEIEHTGNYLRTLRLGKGLSIKDASEATRISEVNLNAIEDHDFSALPANTFTRGLLNIYATFLETDAEVIVAKFMEEREASTTQKRRSRQKPPRKILKPKRLAEPTHVSSMTMAGALFLVIVISFTGFCFYTSWNPFSFLVKETNDIQSAMKSVFPGEKAALPPTREEIIEVTADKVPSKTSLLPATTEEPVIEQSQENPPAEPVIEPDTENLSVTPETLEAHPANELFPSETVPLIPEYTVTIRFLENTIVEMTRDDYDPIEKEFMTGDVQTWTADASMTLHFSVPDSAEIIVNDSAVAFPEVSDANGTYSITIPTETAEP